MRSAKAQRHCRPPSAAATAAVAMGGEGELEAKSFV